MSNQYIVAIDGGTQSTKVAIFFDIKGNEVCSHSVKLREIELYENGIALHPDDDLWDSLLMACEKKCSKKNFQETKKTLLVLV